LHIAPTSGFQLNIPAKLPELSMQALLRRAATQPSLQA
jgi:hypothetical protein